MSDANASGTIDLSLIICCYNEEKILENNVSRLTAFLDNLKLSYELIFVDDCSRDNTKQLIEKIIRDYDLHRIKTIYHEVNRGRGAAVKSGIRVARGKVAGFLDIDLEVSEIYIWPCIKPLLDGQADLSLGFRIYKIQMNFYILSRHILSQLYRRFIRNLLDISVRDTECGYKFFRRDKILPLLPFMESDHWFYDTEIIAIAELFKLRIIEIPCLFIRNTRKKSTVKIVRDSLLYILEAFRFHSRKKNISTEKLVLTKKTDGELAEKKAETENSFY